RKKPSQSMNSIKPLAGVSVLVINQAKKTENTVVIATRVKPRTKVFQSAFGTEASLNAIRQPSRPQTIGCPGELIWKLLKKSSTIGYAVKQATIAMRNTMRREMGFGLVNRWKCFLLAAGLRPVICRVSSMRRVSRSQTTWRAGWSYY